MLDKHRTLDEIRRDIDALDLELQTLIERRAHLACEVAHIKFRHTSNIESFYRPEREALVLSRIMSRNQGPLTDTQIRFIFREIMSACLALEVPLKIGFLGPEGSYTHAALIHHFGRSASPLTFEDPSEVCRAVTDKRAHYGVLPIYNVTTGYIRSALDPLLDSALTVIGETRLNIHHNLLGRSTLEGALEHIERVYAHPQSFAQCAHRLRAHTPHAALITTTSNARAAERASQDPRGAAIASSAAGALYQLTSLVQNISDHVENLTHFWVVARADSLKNEPSESTQALEPGHTEPSWITLLTVARSHLTEVLHLCERAHIRLERVSPYIPYTTTYYETAQDETTQYETTQDETTQHETKHGSSRASSELYVLELGGHAQRPPLSEVIIELKRRGGSRVSRVLGSVMRDSSPVEQS